jgi:hypothetical protein
MYEFNPGSDEAIKKGCICPVLDNGHGKGCGWNGDDGNPCFWITEGCPIHPTEIKDTE